MIVRLDLSVQANMFAYCIVVCKKLKCIEAEQGRLRPKGSFSRAQIVHYLPQN